MAKGKNKAAAARRKAAQDTDQIMRLQADIAAETTRLSAALQVCAAVADADRRITAARDRTATAVADELALLDAQAGVWTRYTSPELVDRAQRINDRAMVRSGFGEGCGLAATERMMRHVGLKANLIMDPQKQGLDHEAVMAIDAARGITHHPLPDDNGPMDYDWGVLVANSIFADLPDGLTRHSCYDDATTDDQRAAYTHGQAMSRAIVGSAPGRYLNSVNVQRWQPTPLPDATLPTGLLQQLGAPATNPASPDGDGFQGPIPPPTADMPADLRRRIATLTHPQPLTDDWAANNRLWRDMAAAVGRYRTAMAPRPRAARPVDAALLRHHYHLAGVGQWARDWDSGTTTAGLAELTVAAGAAAPFWLPPGQTSMFIDADPMDPSLADDLRLPFPNVFCAFADPLRIPPATGTTQPIPDGVLARLTHAFSAPHLADIAAAALADHPHVLSAAADHWGAWVEGLILTADVMGRPTDTVGWCVAVCPSPGVTLARIVIPASVARSPLQAVVQSTMAVVGWAGWDQPDTGSAPPPLPPRGWLDLPDGPDTRDTHLTDLAAVRVLNVRHTHTSSHPSDGEGRSIRPHLRRGHWRRARVGQGRADTRWVRIAPTVVNAGKGTPTGTIYRLPTTRDGAS